jgi:hypothetical protein
MDTSESSRPSPIRWGIGLLVLGLLGVMALGYARWANRPAHSPPGWLWPTRVMTATELFQENGIALENVSHYKIITGLEEGLGERLRLWWHYLDWKQSYTWTRLPHVHVSEREDIYFKPGTYALAPEVEVYPDELVLWTHRGQPVPVGPNAWDSESTTYFRDFSQYGRNAPQCLLGPQFEAAPTFPAYERVELLLTHATESLHHDEVRLKVRDPKAWLLEAAGIAGKMESWEWQEWSGDLEVRIDNFGVKGDRAWLIMKGDEATGTVTLMPYRRD